MKPSKEDKARVAMWMTVIEFSLKAIRDELDMDGLMTDHIVDALARIDLGLGFLRQQLEIE